jgi:Tol biopolymer transport system component
MWKLNFKLLTAVIILWNFYCFAQITKTDKESDIKAKDLIEELKSSKFRIIYETYRDKNWELVIVDADGTNTVNITNTPLIDELYPHVSPDGTKVVFLAERRKGNKRTCDVYLMNIDGTGRVKVGQNGRQPFWSPDGKIIGFAVGSKVYQKRGSLENQQLYFYNIETGEYYPHPNEEIAGLLNPCWSPDGKWIIASIFNAMGFGESIIALQTDGLRVVELRRSAWEAPSIYQCRPDIRPDGKRIAWGWEDEQDYMAVEIGDIDLRKYEPEVTNLRQVVTVPYPLQTYHVDWSADGKYIAYAQGGRGNKMMPANFVIGMKAPGWDIWVAKPSSPHVAVQITHDGLSNKEPDWIPAPPEITPKSDGLKEQLSNYEHKIVHESFQEDNWEIFICQADGSKPVNLTNSSAIDELYPHVSPDGKKIVFCADEGQGDKKIRSVYYMNIDGTKRTKVADNARQSCWNPDGTKIAYLKGKNDHFTNVDYATVGLFIYDVKTDTHIQHPNKKLSNLYNICWHPDGQWFFATVHAGMGYGHANLAIEAQGNRVYDMGIGGCRPDISPDGKKIAWGASDLELKIADLDFSSIKPKINNIQTIAATSEPTHIYHVDFSPDGKFVTFSNGPGAKRMGLAPEIVGIEANQWDICVADPLKKDNWIKITNDGLSNKEPDWVFVIGQDK